MPTYTGADGARLHYDERATPDAEGPPLVVLAGGAGRHPDYLGDLAGLSARRPLVVPHLRGVGRSRLPHDAETASFWQQAEDVERLRVHLGLERLHVVAHSAGTRLALAHAARFPQHVAALVLVTPPAAHLVDVPPDTADLLESRRGEPAFDLALKAWSAGPEGPDDVAFGAWQTVLAPLGYAAWDRTAWDHAVIGSYSYDANRAFFSVEAPDDLATHLGAVTAPVLVVAGAQDCVVGRAPVVALASLFPAGRAVTIDASGHYPWVEQPAAFRAAVDAFLEVPTA